MSTTAHGRQKHVAGVSSDIENRRIDCGRQ
jgi:hypothetical protein